MLDLIREAPLGQAIRFISQNRLLQHPEERADFELPAQYAALLRSDNDPKPEGRASLHDDDDDEDGHNRDRNDTSPAPEPADDADPDLEMLKVVRSAPYSNDRLRAEETLAVKRTKSLPIAPEKTLDGVVLVDWYTTDDPANPQNWSTSRKNLVVFILCIYTCTVYCAGPIYSTASEGIVERFGVSPVAATLGLSLYVLAYGIGDLLFAPLTEIPVIGRNIVYYLTFIVFWVLSFPTAVVDSFGGLLALRFWMGFFR